MLLPDPNTCDVMCIIRDKDSCYSSRLQRIFLLIDGSVGVTPTDEIGLNMLEEFGKSYTVSLIIIKLCAGVCVCARARAPARMCVYVV